MIEIKQPKIRFKGHINDWEERKLGDIFVYKQGQQVPVENQFTKRGKNRHRFIRIVDLTTNNEAPRYIEYSGDNIISSTDLFMIRYGQPGVIGYGYEGVIANNLFKLIPKVKANNRFFKYRLDSMCPKIQSLSSSTTMPAISFKSLDVLDVRYPDIKEQEKIGSFFEQLDDTITLHQQKLEVTKQFKQTMLKKMFPKNGETTPEIRFKGFTEDWEEFKLGDLCNISSGHNWKSKDYTVDGRFKVITIANVTGDYFINTDIGNNIDISNVDNKYVLKENDILITMTGNVGRVSKVPDGDYLLNQRVCKISPKSIDNEFLYTILSDIQFENYCVLQGQGLAQANISNKDILNYKISIPNIKEQIIISNFFKNIDMNIFYLENKIEQNKLFKSSMLKNLFI